MIKGARLIQSEGQAKLYFAPSIKNQTEPSGPHLLQERVTLLFHSLAFKGKGHAVGPGHAQVTNEIVTRTGNSIVMLGDQLNYNLP